MGPRPSLNGQRKNPYLNFKGPPIHVNGLNPSSIIVLADSATLLYATQSLMMKLMTVTTEKWTVLLITVS
jgi:hypothetical protein